MRGGDARAIGNLHLELVDTVDGTVDFRDNPDTAVRNEMECIEVKQHAMLGFLYPDKGTILLLTKARK